jgi:hypothetical protein
MYPDRCPLGPEEEKTDHSVAPPEPSGEPETDYRIYTFPHNERNRIHRPGKYGAITGKPD